MASTSQFVAVPNPGTPATLVNANLLLDGTGATGRALIFTAGANGALVPYIRFFHLGTNGAQTVARVFRNNGQDAEIAANNALIGEKTIPSNTLVQNAASTPQDLALNMTLKGGERLYVTLGTAVTAGIKAAVMNGGDY